MKTIFVAALIIGIGGAAGAQGFGDANRSGSGNYGTGSNSSSHYVSPYTNSQGSTVQGHYQTNPNSTQYDNYGTRGNMNPHNGSTGTREPRY